jgi:hypothetical protein
LIYNNIYENKIYVFIFYLCIKTLSLYMYLNFYEHLTIYVIDTQRIFDHFMILLKKGIFTSIHLLYLQLEI